MTIQKKIAVAIIVAHPDDETLWAGGTILENPFWHCFILSLCRKNDPDRSQKFYSALKVLKSRGVMGDLDDGPGQIPLDIKEVERTIMELLPKKHFDLVITHHTTGEYTRHIRHEETSRAVIALWRSGEISASELWTFAYKDSFKKHNPIAIEFAPEYRRLCGSTWQKKYSLITEVYGFDENSWEAKTTPRAEAFWRLPNLHSGIKRIRDKRAIL